MSVSNDSLGSLGLDSSQSASPQVRRGRAPVNRYSGRRRGGLGRITGLGTRHVQRGPVGGESRSRLAQSRLDGNRLVGGSRLGGSRVLPTRGKHRKKRERVGQRFNPRNMRRQFDTGRAGKRTPTPPILLEAPRERVEEKIDHAPFGANLSNEIYRVQLNVKGKPLAITHFFDGDKVYLGFAAGKYTVANTEDALRLVMQALQDENGDHICGNALFNDPTLCFQKIYHRDQDKFLKDVKKAEARINAELKRAHTTLAKFDKGVNKVCHTLALDTENRVASAYGKFATSNPRSHYLVTGATAVGLWEGAKTTAVHSTASAIKNFGPKAFKYIYTDYATHSLSSIGGGLLATAVGAYAAVKVYQLGKYLLGSEE